MTDNQEILQSEQSEKSEQDEKAKQEPNNGRPWIQISMNEDRSILVTGWVHDTIISYGLLESARDAIHDSRLKEKRIESVNKGRIMDIFRGRK